MGTSSDAHVKHSTVRGFALEAVVEAEVLRKKEAMKEVRLASLDDVAPVDLRRFVAGL